LGKKWCCNHTACTWLWSFVQKVCCIDLIFGMQG
jgi:hypothetical protein